MKLIIEIPDYEYSQIKEHVEKSETILAVYSYIYHGIPYEDRPKREWIPVYGRNGKTIMAYHCSECGFTPKRAIITDFCGGCGADMRGGKE